MFSSILFPQMINGKELGHIAIGSWSWGDKYWGAFNDKDSIDTLYKAIELGITHIDSAFKYGNGHSEKLCGSVLKGKWDSVCFATKGNIKSKPDSIVHQLEQSLGNIKHDHIDLYYIHWPRSNWDLRPYFERLLEQKDKGKIGAIGVSNFTVSQMEQVLEVCPIDACQFGYNAIWRVPERDLIPFCKKQNIHMFAYSPLAQGILTGKFPKQPSFQNGDHRDCTVFFSPEFWNKVYTTVTQMKRICENSNCSLLSASIQFFFNNNHNVTPIIGARNTSQMLDIDSASTQTIPQELMEEFIHLSNNLISQYPNETNIFKWYP